MSFAALLVTVLIALSPIHARAVTTDVAADNLLNTVRGWQDLHRAYPELIPWDDGWISEGISDFVVHRLATHWESFHELATIARADTAFGSWVVLHIDATTDEDELASIVRHARARVPSRSFAALRRRILETARAATAEERGVASPPRYTPPR